MDGIQGKDNILCILQGTATVLRFALAEIEDGLGQRLLEEEWGPGTGQTSCGSQKRGLRIKMGRSSPISLPEVGLAPIRCRPRLYSLRYGMAGSDISGLPPWLQRGAKRSNLEGSLGIWVHPLHPRRRASKPSASPHLPAFLHFKNALIESILNPEAALFPQPIHLLRK